MESVRVNQYSLNQVYADPRVARCLEGHPLDEHRARVLRALAPAEPIHAFWWGEVGGLVLATDRRLLQFPKMLQRRLLMGYNIRFETWAHPYAVLDHLEFIPGSFFELARVMAHKTDGSPVAIVLGKVDPVEREAFVRDIEALLAAWRVRSETEQSALDASTPPLDVDRGAIRTAERDTEPGGLAAELQALYDLYRSGGLTDEEYQQAKARLLER
jgi:hypothetical protein